MPQTGTQNIGTQNNIAAPRKIIVVAQAEGAGQVPAAGETHATVGASHEEGPHNPLAEHPAWYYSGLGLFVAIIIIGLVFFWRREALRSRNPSRGQALLEQAVESITWFCRNAIGPGGEKYAPLVGTIFSYVLVSNLMSVLPLYWKNEGTAAGTFTPAPTANLSMTLALGLIVFVVFNYIGIKANGIGNYLKHFAGPIWWLSWLMFPIELISMMVRPFSLAIRLFGNVFGEETVIAVLIAMGATLFFIPIQLPMLVFGVFGSLIQAGVFTILTCAYIGLAIGDHEHGDHEDHAEGAHGHGDNSGAVAAVAH